MIANQSKDIEQEGAKAAKVWRRAVFVRHVWVSKPCRARVKNDTSGEVEEKCEKNVAHLAHHAKTVEITGVFCIVRSVPVGTPRGSIGTARRRQEIGGQKPEVGDQRSCFGRFDRLTTGKLQHGLLARDQRAPAMKSQISYDKSQTNSKLQAPKGSVVDAYAQKWKELCAARKKAAPLEPLAKNPRNIDVFQGAHAASLEPLAKFPRFF